jgi:predicted amidohydrolase
MEKITLVQPDIVWENIDANLDSLEEMLDPLAGQTDLILLPELFTTGFTMRSKQLAESMGGRTMNWMKRMAGRVGSDIAGSLIIHENGYYYNRLIWMHQDGIFQYYDKRHLFRMSGENESYSYGRDQIIVESGGLRFKPMICYDLRFPVWSRNKTDYDVLVYVANWPAQRKDVWDVLLRARAIENQAYVLGVNRIGTDGMDISYHGHTVALDAKGEQLAFLENGLAGHITVRLPVKELIRFREKFPVWKDADSFSLDT